MTATGALESQKVLPVAGCNAHRLGGVRRGFISPGFWMWTALKCLMIGRLPTHFMYFSIFAYYLVVSRCYCILTAIISNYRECLPNLPINTFGNTISYK